jgi:hypothetical protein
MSATIAPPPRYEDMRIRIELGRSAEGGTMKRNMFSVLNVLALAMVLGVPMLQAQSRLIADVPFDFSLGQRSMMEGQYEILSISQQAGELRNLDTETAEVFIKSIRVEAGQSGHARLVFNKYGKQYFLSEIWDGNSNTGIRLPKSPREKEVSLAGNRFSDGPETVIVAMK